VTGDEMAASWSRCAAKWASAEKWQWAGFCYGAAMSFAVGAPFPCAKGSPYAIGEPPPKPVKVDPRQLGLFA
jgi:hypothetical protein